MFAPFNLRHPRVLKSTTSRRDPRICICTKCQNALILHGDRFFSDRRPFLPLSAAGHAGGRVYTRCKFGPRPGSVARALGVQSRGIWQVPTGSHFASSSPAGQWKPHNQDFCSTAAADSVSYLYHTVPQALKLYFVAATVQQQSHSKLILL